MGVCQSRRKTLKIRDRNEGPPDANTVQVSTRFIWSRKVQEGPKNARGRKLLLTVARRRKISLPLRPGSFDLWHCPGPSEAICEGNYPVGNYRYTVDNQSKPLCMLAHDFSFLFFLFFALSIAVYCILMKFESNLKEWLAVFVSVLDLTWDTAVLPSSKMVWTERNKRELKRMTAWVSVSQWNGTARLAGSLTASQGPASNTCHIG